MKAERDILVVDDEKVVSDAVLKICRAEGLRADAASSGREGLERMDACRYRLALCDIMMEDLDGFEILAALEKRDDAPVAAMITGFATVEYAMRSLALGAADFLPKPFTADELLAVVRRGLALEKLRAEAAPFVPCPPDYYRLGRTAWVKTEPAGTALIGVCDSFLKTLGGLEGLSLFDAGEEIHQGSGCAEARAPDGSAHRLLCPLSGRILETNAAAAAVPALVEKDPYFQGWLYRIVPENPESDLGQLTACSSDRR